MSDSGRALPPDHAVRERIRDDLSTNLLVEAGAGSGKTTALVDRMLALVRSGRASTEQLAAVTFTRKAAAELRERFQNRVEVEIREAAAGTPEHVRLAAALTDIDRAFLGTIHAFAARLLRERPLEAGLDPAFEEMLETETDRYAAHYWAGYLERAAADGDSGLERIAQVGLRPHELERAFRTLVDNLDVRFPSEEEARPSQDEIAPVRRRVEAVLDRALAILPEREPPKGWGNFQRKVMTAEYSRTHLGWDDARHFFDALHSLMTFDPGRITLSRWFPDTSRQDPIRELRDELTALTADEACTEVLDRWLAHRYPAAIDFARAAAEAFQEERWRMGRLSFQDLLSLTVRLLRTHPQARAELGRRYRYLMIDEFQDTDPLQAEIVFLLSSPPTQAELEGGPVDWRRAMPEEGSLFVVGDPKQSIYRFRRADIGVYNAVRARFEEIGDVLTLESNFRSVLDIAGITNDVFTRLFPHDEDEAQARYADMRPQRPSTDGAGVFSYTLPGKGRWSTAHARSDAERLASWIRARVDAGERQPGDFLLLVRRKKHLGLYARALEDRNLPIDVSGAGVGFEHELGELLLLLRALTDPGDPVRSVAVLTGLFFGLDHEQLLQHREADGDFDFTRLSSGGSSAVERALGVMAEWWAVARDRPADVFIGRLVDELGLFPLAAASPLGGLRAGALAYALDAVRQAALGGETSLVGAIEALETAMDWEEAEAPLLPGRSDVVRVMNVHKAKGLEAPVVILAEPFGRTSFPPRLHVERGSALEPRAYLEISDPDDFHVPLARPRHWRDLAEREGRFEAAERDRLLYVSVTRAMDELVVGRVKGRSDQSPWGELDGWLEEHAQDLGELEAVLPPGRTKLPSTGAEIAALVDRADTERMGRSEPTFLYRTVTQLVKDTPSGESDDASFAGEPIQGGAPTERFPRGYEWGSVVHAGLAAAARGLDDDALAVYCRSLLVEYERPVDDRGEPLELEELLAMISRVRDTDLWRRAVAAGTVLAEVPFASWREGPSPSGVLVEGVVDLAFEDDEGWTIADYKTDVGDDPDFDARTARYRRQVEEYARIWRELSGDPVARRVLLYTTLDREIAW